MKNYQHALLFYHTKSGQTEIHDTLGQATAYLSQFCQTLTLHQTMQAGDIEKHCSQLSADIDLLISLGGDGTANELINGVVKNELDIALAILPGGTFNDFTRTLQLAPNVATAAEQLTTAQEIYYDVLKINEHYALNFVGLGFMVQNAENVDADAKSAIGKFSYVLSTLKTLGEENDFTYNLTVDGKTYEGETFMMMIASGLFIGGNRLPLTDLSPNDGVLNAFIFNTKTLGTLRDFFTPKDSFDWGELGQNITVLSGKHFTVTTTPPQTLDIDGEIMLETPIEVSVLPKRVRILTHKNTNSIR